MECPRSLRAVRKASDKAALPGGTRGQPELTLHTILFSLKKKQNCLSISAVPGLSGSVTGLLVVPWELLAQHAESRSPSRYRTQAPRAGSTVLAAGPPGKPLRPSSNQSER